MVPDDLPAIARLLARSHAVDGIPRIDRQELEAIANRGQLIVLQLQASVLAAAACVATGRGLIFLTTDPEVATREFAIVCGAALVLGPYLARVFSGEQTLLDPVLRRWSACCCARSGATPPAR